MSSYKTMTISTVETNLCSLKKIFEEKKIQNLESTLEDAEFTRP